MINRRFKDYFDKNKLNDEEYDELINLKQDIFKAFEAKDLDETNKLRDELISKNYPKNKFTDKLIWKFTIKSKISSKKYSQNT